MMLNICEDSTIAAGTFVMFTLGFQTSKLQWTISNGNGPSKIYSGVRMGRAQVRRASRREGRGRGAKVHSTRASCQYLKCV